MAVFKCKMCGGNLEIQEGMTVCECEYCGSNQTVPSLDDEKKVNLFTRANRLRSACEFDKAFGVYESIVTEFNEEAEAYWGLILCKYGIEYVDDPKTGKKIPTCHRSSFDSVMDDENFEMVMEYSDPTSRSVYREEAKAIETLRVGIIEVSAKEEPYDIFICYKETDPVGQRTIDSVIAQDVYDVLTEKGYRVFFSRITLEDKLGQEYEPYIFAALNSAKIMLAFGTDYEYYNAVWVKNEWSRFLSLIEKGEKKTLIPCYKGIDAYDMPKEFARLQGQDMGKLGAIQDLVRGIGKILPKDELEKVVTHEVTGVNGGNANVDSLLKRAFMFLEDGNWDSADEYCEKVLDINPECAQAYLGKLMAELKVKEQEKLKNCKETFDENINYKKALRFADESIKNTLVGYIEHIKNRNENERLESIYLKGLATMKKARIATDYKIAAESFKKISNYKDADTLYSKCLEEYEKEKAKEEVERAREKAREEAERAREKAREEAERARKEAEKAREKEKKIKLIELIEKYKDAIRLIKQQQLNIIENKIMLINQEISNLNIEKDSLGLFSGKRKKEIENKISEYYFEINSLTYKKDMINQKQNSYDSVFDFEEENMIETMSNNRTIEEILKEVERYSSAEFVNILKMTSDNKTGEEIYEEIINTLSNILRLRNARKGDCVFFGNYVQEKYSNKRNVEEKQKIEWIVLGIRNNKALIISRYALEYKRYNTRNDDITWEKCSLRSWLNGEFISYAFTTTERKFICDTVVTADKLPEYSINPGNDTKDKIFLLSINEAKKFISSKDEMKCMPTEYAKRNTMDKGQCQWWLRSTGNKQSRAAFVDSNGNVYEDGGIVDYEHRAVRPALWINLES